MELELRIVRDPYGQLAKQLIRVFGEQGGTVGRAPDNFWQLPDPACVLSGRHFDVFFRDGAFWLRDTSRNGTFVNGSESPLGFGRKARLSHGDEIKFATYKVLVQSYERDVPEAPGVARDLDDLTGSDELQNSEEPHYHDESSLPVASSPVAPEIVPAAASTMSDAVAHPHETAADGAHPAPEQAASVHEQTESDVDERSRGRGSAPAAVLDGGPTSDWTATRAIDSDLAAGGEPRIVAVDRARLQAEGHLPPPSLERLIANQFRHIKRPLIRSMLGRGMQPLPNGHLVMVTSSLPAEGKTFCSLNLALSIALERDVGVVLVDADVAKKHLTRIFGLEEEAGLLNALADDLVDVEPLILRTDVRGLSILPAGQCGESDVATELLASTRMDEIAARIGARSAHRIALFDSPPLLLTNESRVLSSLMGQILLIVRSGVTPQQAVVEAISYIDGDKPVGLVLNQSTVNAPGSYYGYGAYGYGDYR